MRLIFSRESFIENKEHFREYNNNNAVLIIEIDLLLEIVHKKRSEFSRFTPFI